MPMKEHPTRRSFLRASLLGTATAIGLGGPVRAVQALADAPKCLGKSRVAVTNGDDRADNIFRGLKVFEKEIANAIGDRRVVIKPNNVIITNPLCATHASCVEGILEFLESIGKTDVIMVEAPAVGSALDGFENYGYMDLVKKYKVNLVDIDSGAFEVMHAFDEKDFQPHPVRMSQILLDPNHFVISAAVMKTHNCVTATLSLKNIVLGAPLKDPGFQWTSEWMESKGSDKVAMHGRGIRGINYNLFAMASKLHPDLAIVDGYTGMEGNGPVAGTLVDHRVAVVGMDWLATDRVAVELMGIDFRRIGYLNYCAQAGLGQADIEQLEIVGPALRDHIKTYRLHDNEEEQKQWMKPMTG